MFRLPRAALADPRRREHRSVRRLPRRSVTWQTSPCAPSPARSTCPRRLLRWSRAVRSVPYRATPDQHPQWIASRWRVLSLIRVSSRSAIYSAPTLLRWPDRSIADRQTFLPDRSPVFRSPAMNSPPRWRQPPAPPRFRRHSLVARCLCHSRASLLQTGSAGVGCPPRRGATSCRSRVSVWQRARCGSQTPFHGWQFRERPSQRIHAGPHWRPPIPRRAGH